MLRTRALTSYHVRHHPGDVALISRDTLIDKAKRAIRRDLSKPIRRIYNDITRQGGGDVEFPEFNSVRSIMGTARRLHVPDIPATILDVAIQGQWAETWSGDEFLLYLDNIWGVAIFATEAYLRRLRKCTDVYMDGTFRTCPHPYGQFFTIHGNYIGRVVPLAFCLLTGKTTGHYRQMLKAVKRGVRRASGHQWRPARIICDFELAIISACETELPTARVSGCYFHFCQSLWRRIQELGLAIQYRQTTEVQKFVRRVMSLGYLPVAVVRHNYRQLCSSRRTLRLFRRYPDMHTFAQYVQRTYFDGQFSPVMWNVYTRNADMRTNNHVEGIGIFYIIKLTLIFYFTVEDL